MVGFLGSKLKTVILSLVKIFSRCLCFLWKQRESDLGTPLTVSLNKSNTDQDSWDDWGGPEIVISHKKKSTTGEHIEAYRQNLAVSRQKSLTTPEEEDIFSDMTPQIRKQKKLFVGKGAEVTPCDRFAVRPEGTDPLLSMSSELESWEEDQMKMGWSSEEASLADLLKEQRFKR